MMAMARLPDDRRERFDGVRGEIRFNEPMSRHTSWRVGGTAEIYFVPADVDDLGLFLRTLEDASPITLTGLGSNLLVRDGGLAGAVICTHKGLDQLDQPDALTVFAEAGVPGAKVARYALRSGLRGAEFLAGIPGTIGGALAMNAGAFGGETWDVVRDVRTINRSGVVRTRNKAEFETGYRRVSRYPNEWFVGAHFALHEGDVDAGRDAIRNLLSRRGESQPVGSANAGSVFRNPEGDFAARLIEQAGLKGTTIGGAEVSKQHANFIINTGDATAADIEDLISLVQRTVEAESHIYLEPEVRIVGDRD